MSREEWGAPSSLEQVCQIGRMEVVTGQAGPGRTQIWGAMEDTGWD